MGWYNIIIKTYIDQFIMIIVYGHADPNLVFNSQPMHIIIVVHHY